MAYISDIRYYYGWQKSCRLYLYLVIAWSRKRLSYSPRCCVASCRMSNERPNSLIITLSGSINSTRLLLLSVDALVSINYVYTTIIYSSTWKKSSNPPVYPIGAINKQGGGEGKMTRSYTLISCARVEIDHFQPQCARKQGSHRRHTPPLSSQSVRVDG